MQDYLDYALRLRAAGQPFVIATVVRAERPTSAKPGATAIVTADGQLTGWVGGSCAQPTVTREALRVLKDGRPLLLRLGPPDRLSAQVTPGVLERPMTCISGGTLEIYLEPHLAQPLLIAVSHLPIAEALAALGKGLGYTVTVVGWTPARSASRRPTWSWTGWISGGSSCGPRPTSSSRHTAITTRKRWPGR